MTQPQKIDSGSAVYSKGAIVAVVAKSGHGFLRRFIFEVNGMFNVLGRVDRAAGSS